MPSLIREEAQRVSPLKQFYLARVRKRMQRPEGKCLVSSVFSPCGPRGSHLDRQAGQCHHRAISPAWVSLSTVKQEQLTLPQRTKVSSTPHPPASTFQVLKQTPPHQLHLLYFKNVYFIFINLALLAFFFFLSLFLPSFLCDSLM